MTRARVRVRWWRVADVLAALSLAVTLPLWLVLTLVIH